MTSYPILALIRSSAGFLPRSQKCAWWHTRVCCSVSQNVSRRRAFSRTCQPLCPVPPRPPASQRSHGGGFAGCPVAPEHGAPTSCTPCAPSLATSAVPHDQRRRDGVRSPRKLSRMSNLLCEP